MKKASVVLVILLLAIVGWKLHVVDEWEKNIFVNKDVYVQVTEELAHVVDVSKVRDMYRVRTAKAVFDTQRPPRHNYVLLHIFPDGTAQGASASYGFAKPVNSTVSAVMLRQMNVYTKAGEVPEYSFVKNITTAEEYEEYLKWLPKANNIFFEKGRIVFRGLLHAALISFGGTALALILKNMFDNYMGGTFVRKNKWPKDKLNKF